MTTLKNKVSIITPSYNRAQYVGETAASIFGQTYENWEWIIVDDGSTDNSMELLREYEAKDSRVKVFTRDRLPKGAATCRNMAVEKCDGDYLIFLDTDDLIESYCLENRVRTMNANPDLDFGIYPSTLFHSEAHDLKLWWNTDNGEDLLMRQFLQDAICQGTGILIKKECFEEVGMWDADLMLWQDIDLFFKLYIKGYKYKLFFDQPPDLMIREHDKSLSRYDFFNKDKQLSRIKMLKTVHELLVPEWQNRA